MWAHNPKQQTGLQWSTTVQHPSLRPYSRSRSKFSLPRNSPELSRAPRWANASPSRASRSLSAKTAWNREAEPTMTTTKATIRNSPHTFYLTSLFCFKFSYSFGPINQDGWWGMACGLQFWCFGALYDFAMGREVYCLAWLLTYGPVYPYLRGWPACTYPRRMECSVIDLLGKKIWYPILLLLRLQMAFVN